MKKKKEDKPEEKEEVKNDETSGLDISGLL